jgi:cell division protein FtsB
MNIKIKNLKKKVIFYTLKLGDIRFVSQVVFAVIVLMITWSGVKSIETNYGLQKQISTLKQKNDLQKLENTNLSLENEYFNSNQYLELVARQDFGLGAPGEKLIIVPETVAMSYTTSIPLTAGSASNDANQPGYQKNFQSWVDFFLHRQSGN